MRRINPYEVLGVEPGADEEAVKAAYRREAKSAHPDAGGSAPEFERLSACRDILLDPARRRRYDETGEFDDAVPNNDRGSAMTIILSHMSRMIDDFVASDFDPACDPARCDDVAVIKTKIAGSIHNARQQLKIGQRHRRAVENVRKRLVRKGKGGENVLTASLSKDIERINRSVAEIESGIRIATLAREIITEYGFEVDKSAFGPRDHQPNRYGRASELFSEEFVDALFGSRR